MTILTMQDAFKALEDVEDNIEVKPAVKKVHKVVNESINTPTKNVKKEIKIEEASSGKDFRKSWSKDGTTYRQTYHITKDEYRKVLDKLEQEKPKDYMGNSTYGNYEYMKEILTDLQGIKKNVIFPNLTSAKYVVNVLGLDNFKSDRNVRFIIDEKLIRKDTNKSLKESTIINLNDEKDVAKGKEELAKSEEKADHIEQIVDVDAETIDELKDSYIGNAILQCPVCKTLIYKKPEALEQSDEDKELYNCEEECPHCGSKEGFKLVGQVAKYETAQDKPEETTGAPKSKPIGDEEKGELDDNEKPEGEEEIDIDEIKLENLDENAFDKLINKYIHNIYENVSEYKTVDGSIDDKNGQLVVEGTIKYNSGKETKTKFVFEAVATTKRGSLKLKGLNETFTKARKPFTLIGRVRRNNTLYCDSLRYNYNVKVLNETKKVKGKTFIRDKN